MKRIAIIGVPIGLLSLIVIVGSSAVWLVMPLGSLCANEIVEIVPSPNDRHRAILFERNCGATTGFSTQVAIVNGSDELPNEPGNVMIADGAPWEASWGFEWTDPATLVIGFHTSEKVHRAETTVNEIAIRYQPRQPGINPPR